MVKGGRGDGSPYWPDLHRKVAVFGGSGVRFFRPELLTAIFFCLLSFVALLPPALVKLGRYEGDILDKLEQLVSNYDGLLVSIGTVFLVLALGIFTTDMVNSAQSRREQASRIMQAELAVAQFRQEWINSLRSKISEVIYLSSLLINSIKDEGYSESVAKLKRLDSEIRLHLNPKEDEAKRLLERLVDRHSPSGLPLDFKIA